MVFVFMAIVTLILFAVLCVCFYQTGWWRGYHAGMKMEADARQERGQ